MDGGGTSAPGPRPARGRNRAFGRPAVRLGPVSALVGAALVVMAAVVSAPPAAQAAFPGSDGPVVFAGISFGFALRGGFGLGFGSPCTGHSPGQDTLYMLRPDSMVPHVLVCAPGQADHPFVSPDGSTVVFSSATNGSPSQLYTAPIPATGQRVTPTLVSSSPADSDSYPSWSPAGDGTIVFQRTLPGGLPQLYTENVADPASATPVFSAPTGSSDTEPVFDPSDPELIAFDRTVGGRSHILTVDLSTQTVTDLSAQGDPNGTGNDSKPDFAPSGSQERIVFESDRACGSMQLYTMSITGAEQEPVFQTVSNGTPTGTQRCRTPSGDPVYAPQGDALAFDQGIGGFFSFFGSGPSTVSVNSSGVATGPVASLSHFFGEAVDPNWGPTASPPAQTPEVGLPVLLPVLGALAVAGTLVVRRRRLRAGTPR